MSGRTPVGPVRTVVLVPHPQRPAAAGVAEDVVHAFEAAGCRVLIEESLAAASELAGHGVSAATCAEAADLAVAIGGDGTLLRAFADFPACPLVGVHCGELGYLAEVEPFQVSELATSAAAGRLETGDRLTLELRREGGTVAVALNDVVVDKRAAGRVVKLAVTVDGESLTTFRADAVIVASPTGSTAYNFSAGGPVVDPDVDAFCITPVAPHGLWNRSLVLPRTSRVQLALRDDRPATVLADGRPVCEIAEGDDVEVAVSAVPARLVQWGGRGVAARVRHAFGSGDPRG